MLPILNLFFGYLVSCNLSIPSHISVLHVEQEVEGDDTVAVESVLESDEVRKKLLDEEKALQQKINDST